MRDVRSMPGASSPAVNEERPCVALVGLPPATYQTNREARSSPSAVDPWPGSLHKRRVFADRKVEIRHCSEKWSSSEIGKGTQQKLVNLEYEFLLRRCL